jgi:hypothetical protein
MRTIYNNMKWLIAGVLMLILSSCEDFLERNPLDKLSTQTFWSSEDDVETALAGVYSRLHENFLGYERVYLDGLSDNAWSDPGNGNQSNMANMTTGSISAGLGGAMENMYSSPYRAISSCNYFLENVDKSPVEEEDLNIYKAEVRFIRALCYFDLVQLFGDVIIYRTYPETPEESKIAKSPKEEVYAYIEEDLEFAVTHLPDIEYEGNAVKGSAQGLLGRVLLTQEKWAEATVILSQVSSEIFSLSDDYQGLFLTDGQDDNSEIMFSTRYLEPNSVHRTEPGAAGMNIEMGWWSLLQPYQDLADSYKMTDGLPADESTLFDPADPYANRDPRLGLSVKLPNESWVNDNGDTITNMNESLTGGFLMEKYVNIADAPFTTASATETDQDLIHLRYADVLLMYAEARNEASGPDPSVYSALNQVRARQGINMPPVDQARYGTQEALRELIRDDRRAELALEGHRYMDLKRWRIAHIKLPTLQTPDGTQLVFEERNYYLPFQLSELDRNPQLVQTDGY